MSETVRIRLRIPEGRPGDVIKVDSARADALVNARYAERVDQPAEPPAVETQASPVTTLPEVTDLKGEWEKAAEGLGISLVDDEGKPLTKADLIEAVQAATGADA